MNRIVSSLDPAFKNVLEFRHESWWTKEVYDELTKNKIIFCSVSHPDLPPTLIKNTETMYIRLHGNKQMFYSDYSNAELDQLSEEIFEQKRIKEVYVYFNNTASTAGILNALYLKKTIKER